jgi:CheY-like chemotaxis protein
MTKNILLVDDDQDDIDLFVEAMQTISNDINLVIAHNGLEALDCILRDGLPVDHIFLDINMPKMNGIECLEELSKRKTFPPPFVTIYTTSGKDSAVYEKCKKLGARFITKPSTYVDLIQTLKVELN